MTVTSSASAATVPQCHGRPGAAARKSEMMMIRPRQPGEGPVRGPEPPGDPAGWPVRVTAAVTVPLLEPGRAFTVHGGGSE